MFTAYKSGTTEHPCPAYLPTTFNAIRAEAACEYMYVLLYYIIDCIIYNINMKPNFSWVSLRNHNFFAGVVLAMLSVR